MTNKIKQQMTEALLELEEASKHNIKPGDILVIGCSSSEIMGKCIGTGSSEEAASAVMSVLLPFVKKYGLYLAVQCCEHLNRSLVVERACMEKYDLSEVWVVPQLHAGGAMAMQAKKCFKEPVMVEDIKMKASLGIDIGGTFIGMHMHAVVVPIHAKTRKIGEANISMARTRPKYVGGPRAIYDASYMR